MHAHLAVPPNRTSYFSIGKPFSGFQFIDDYYAGNPAARRLFSLARSFGSRTLVVEEIDPAGVIEEENVQILSLYPGFTPGALRRISFWRTDFKTSRGLESQESKQLVGYAILKRDIHPKSLQFSDGWHVFEAVFRKYEHDHNCVPLQGKYNVAICGNDHEIEGVLYCQQNSMNKVCAHVAIRSLLSRLVPADPISYSHMNAVASWNPAIGLTTPQIRKILTSYGIEYYDIDYDIEEKKNSSVRDDLPYQKLIYSGVESGKGGLLGFSMSGPQAGSSRHIIPFYGHTFNKDTWAPDAEASYFNIGANYGYIPSESWTSSFLGHDDNFGMNFCIPRLYIKPAQVNYAVEILEHRALYGGMVAEALALGYIYSLYKELDSTNPWNKRLAYFASPGVQQVILRAVCVEKSVYINHLAHMEDWHGNKENPLLIPVLEKLRADLLWVVEVSVPQLFSANERKLGEVVLDAQKKRQQLVYDKFDFSSYIIARFPGKYFLLPAVNQHGPAFCSIPSNIQSHVDLLRLQ